MSGVYQKENANLKKMRGNGGDGRETYVLLARLVVHFAQLPVLRGAGSPGMCRTMSGCRAGTDNEGLLKMTGNLGG